VIPLLGPEAESYQQTGKVPKRHGSRSEIAAPRNVFGTADGRWVSLSAPMQSMAERLFRTIGREDMIDDPRFSSNQQRLKHADECEAAIAAFIGARPFDEVMGVFEQAQVTVAPVNEVDQVIRDPHIVARETLVTLPDEDLTTIAMHNVAPRLSGTPGSIRFAAPKHGEHTAQVLASLGFSDADIRDLDAQGVIRQHRGDAVADAVANAVTNESGTHGDSDVGAKADTEANSAPAGTLASTPVGTRTR
jgi:formyl-CoA transferase